jgi:hypothetical protein
MEYTEHMEHNTQHIDELTHLESTDFLVQTLQPRPETDILADHGNQPVVSDNSGSALCQILRRLQYL